MAMFFEKRKARHKGKRMEAAYPSDDRYQTEDDLKALVRKKKIEKDLDRKKRVQNLAKEKMATRKRRGKVHAETNTEREDANLVIPKGPGPRQMGLNSNLKEKIYPQSHEA